MSDKTDTYPLIPIPYGTVLFPGKTLHISPANREDVVAIIAKYYSGALKTGPKANAPLIGCVPLRSPLLSADGKKLIEDGGKAAKPASEPDVNNISKNDLFQYGCIARISGIRGGRQGDVALVVDGLNRCKITQITSEKPYFEAKLQEFKDAVDVWDPAVKGAFAHLKELSRELFQIVRLSSMVSKGPGMSPLLIRQLEAFVARKDISEAGFLADFMAVLGQSSYEDKLWLLSATSVVHRIQRANELVQRQISTIQSSTRIIQVTNNSNGGIDMDKLRELQKRNQSGNTSNAGGGMGGMPPGMGSADEADNEVEELKKRLDESGLSEEAQKVAVRELKRLVKMNPAQAEYSVIRNYLENLAEIPWTKLTEDKLDAATLSRARKQLDDDHYGLEKIKKRLLEYLAVLKLKQSTNADLEAQIKSITEKDATAREQDEKAVAPKAKTESAEVAKKEPIPDSSELLALKNKRMIDKSPIMLLVGPPGTGKTSLAKSVATALGRKFHRISLGGVRDEAEIRGHRRTYVAAMPGLIVSGLKKVGVANPVFLLDEIDKVGTSNFHGDPSAAMLEVLDPEQNHTFTDHYVNIPLDLSKVLFIATANTLDTIPPALLDRMETISLAGYTTLEKRHIATRHLIPKQITTNGLQINDVEIPEDVVDKVITSYTRESGVRNLERELGSVCRYKAVQYAESKDSSSVEGNSKAVAYHAGVTVPELEDILGIERFEEELAASSTPRPGVVTGLVAFSTLGQGSILFIEVAEMPGTGRVQLTGKLGDVLKESVEVALTWVKAHAFDLGITADPHEDVMARRAIHVHCPAGAVPKDGPSAGLAHTIALISLFMGKPVPPTLAMTGEVSLRGKVTPVGGIKEKLIGALRAGVKTVLLPQGNRKDVRDCPEEVKQGMEIVHVEHIWEALKIVWPDETWEGKQRWAVESRL
ncbi:MAG: hypothetical protein M1828_006706 [Chrysothrix sp. TS-e1954]|nr:MAG: hypothetical protein M1828_006706 [Chrysothrix sp. TS-e1954]